jgi:hypothetical protein
MVEQACAVGDSHEAGIAAETAKRWTKVDIADRGQVVEIRPAFQRTSACIMTPSPELELGPDSPEPTRP